MTQSNLLELAKQGDSQAISTLMNRSLQPKGITAKVALKEGYLHIMLEAAKVPEQQALVSWVRQSLTVLGAISIERVKIYGRQTEEEFPTWHEEFETTNIGETAQAETSIPKTKSSISSQFNTLNVSNSANNIASHHIQSPNKLACQSSISQQSNRQSINTTTNKGASTRIQSQSKPNRPHNYLVPSILVTLFAFFPVGIAALIYASQVENKYNQGDYRGAQSTSNTAKILCIVGAGIAAPFYLLFLLGFGFAIFAPSLSNSKAKAIESEAKTSIGAIDRSQQAYHIENGNFASNLEDLELGFVSSESSNYRYNVSLDQEKAIVTATAKQSGTRSYVGAMFFVGNQYENVVCQTERPSQTTPELPQLIGNKAQCPTGTSSLE